MGYVSEWKKGRFLVEENNSEWVSQPWRLLSVLRLFICRLVTDVTRSSHVVMSFSCHSVFVRHLLLIKLRYVALVYICATTVDCVSLDAINRDILLKTPRPGCHVVAFHIGFNLKNLSVVILPV